MHSNFYEVSISKIDPVVTRAPPGLQNMSKIMAKMQNEHVARANKATGGPNPSPAWPRGLPRQFDYPAGRVGGFGVQSIPQLGAISHKGRRSSEFFFESDVYLADSH
jgi:hypothetical protein